MTSDARTQLDELRAAVGASGFSCRERIEMADEIASGIRAAATDLGCRMVVMARGLTRRGTGLVDKVAADFAVPVLAIGRLREVS